MRAQYPNPTSPIRTVFLNCSPQFPQVSLGYQYGGGHRE